MGSFRPEIDKAMLLNPVHPVEVWRRPAIIGSERYCS